MLLVKVDKWFNETTQQWQNIYMQTIVCDDNAKDFKRNGSKKPICVIMHGYGSSGALFYRFYQALQEHFCLLLVDLVGMGGSSRPDDIDIFTIEPAELLEYYLKHLETWRLKMNNLTDFYLMAHSFGGYISSHYAVRYPQHIKKLLLLSPIGLRPAPKDEDV